MLSDDELENFIKNPFIKKAEDDEFLLLKQRAEANDVFGMFNYGEQCYYREKYVESAYWIRKAFLCNHNQGRIYLGDLWRSADRKIRDKYEDVKCDGYGFDPENPVLVMMPIGEKEYLQSIKPKNGQLISFCRMCCVASSNGTMIDKYEVYTISDYPELKPLKYIVYFNMYALDGYGKMIEGFESIKGDQK